MAGGVEDGRSLVQRIRRDVMSKDGPEQPVAIEAAVPVCTLLHAAGKRFDAAGANVATPTRAEERLRPAASRYGRSHFMLCYLVNRTARNQKRFKNEIFNFKTDDSYHRGGGRSQGGRRRLYRIQRGYAG